MSGYFNSKICFESEVFTIYSVVPRFDTVIVRLIGAKSEIP